ncbi:Gfo/Idh/MocA family oxidoreductase [Sulfitobacter albidus]|uniref:Gfo/Idh/MocA family oxidoreductase n=1 Tax=Sulfitobacter albidus TaxID=2829501 RepID=A0A975JCN6_9RHOB|nr:Gfo/Idh/MocA family oxidoreductase [Sulfitobacter albidus]QUJ76044.1 Gfo/Idh/MocA family oxidoreductase [Sulfitobacter albidus]
MTGARALRVAGLGAGYFSQFHYDSWARMPRVDLVGACDLDIALARATGLPAHDDLGRMLRATAPDLLDIIVPPDAQATAIRTALDAGLKWIICQKPFCRDIPEARTMIHAAQDAGATLIVHENFRFQPWYRRIKRALAQDAIGDVHQMSFRLRPGDGQGVDAYLSRQPYFQTMPRFLVHETAVHWVDTFRYLLGDPISVYADLRRLNPAIAGEDAGHILFEHPGGQRSFFDGNRHLDHATDNPRRTMGEALVEGTQGTLSLAGDGAVYLRSFGERSQRILLGADTHTGFGGDCVHALQSHVVAGILDGAPIENTAQDYLTVMRVEAAIYASAASGTRQTLSDTP